MRQPDLCDGCLQPLEDGEPYVGRDEYPLLGDEDEDDEVDPVDDESYQYRFHWFEDARCEFAFIMRRIADAQS